MPTGLTAPLAYPGSKSVAPGSHGAARQIAALLPDDVGTYCEPFAGMLGILLSRNPVDIEIVNDLDVDVVNWWRVLRTQPNELAEQLLLTPNARAELAACAVPDANDSDLERARKFAVCCMQSLQTTANNNHWWRRNIKPNSTGTKAWDTIRNKINNGTLAALASRLQLVQIEQIDAVDLIKRVGKETGALMYVDPPYQSVQAYYRQTVDFSRLQAALLECKAKVAVSGYPGECELLDAADGWQRYDFAANMSMSVNLQGLAKSKKQRTECLWVNYQPNTQLRLI